MELTMVKVVFVGDKPSKLNINCNVPFVGAKCFKRVLDWIKIIAPDFYVCYNVNQHWGLDKRALNDIIDLHEAGFKVVALGLKAHTALDERGVPHYELPHPSGLNVKLNNREYVDTCLNNAKSYVRIAE